MSKFQRLMCLAAVLFGSLLSGCATPPSNFTIQAMGAGDGVWLLNARTGRLYGCATGVVPAGCVEIDTGNVGR